MIYLKTNNNSNPHSLIDIANDILLDCKTRGIGLSWMLHVDVMNIKRLNRRLSVGLISKDDYNKEFTNIFVKYFNVPTLENFIASGLLGENFEISNIGPKPRKRKKRKSIQNTKKKPGSKKSNSNALTHNSATPFQKLTKDKLHSELLNIVNSDSISGRINRSINTKFQSLVGGKRSKIIYKSFIDDINRELVKRIKGDALRVGLLYGVNWLNDKITERIRCEIVEAHRGTKKIGKALTKDLKKQITQITRDEIINLIYSQISEYYSVKRTHNIIPEAQRDIYNLIHKERIEKEKIDSYEATQILLDPEKFDDAIKENMDYVSFISRFNPNSKAEREWSIWRNNLGSNGMVDSKSGLDFDKILAKEYARHKNRKLDPEQYKTMLRENSRSLSGPRTKETIELTKIKKISDHYGVSIEEHNRIMENRRIEQEKEIERLSELEADRKNKERIAKRNQSSINKMLNNPSDEYSNRDLQSSVSAVNDILVRSINRLNNKIKEEDKSYALQEQEIERNNKLIKEEIEHKRSIKKLTLKNSKLKNIKILPVPEKYHDLRIYYNKELYELYESYVQMNLLSDIDRWRILYFISVVYEGIARNKSLSVPISTNKFKRIVGVSRPGALYNMMIGPGYKTSNYYKENNIYTGHMPITTNGIYSKVGRKSRRYSIKKKYLVGDVWQTMTIKNDKLQQQIHSSLVEIEAEIKESIERNIRNRAGGYKVVYDGINKLEIDARRAKSRINYLQKNDKLLSKADKIKLANGKWKLTDLYGNLAETQEDVAHIYKQRVDSIKSRRFFHSVDSFGNRYHNNLTSLPSDMRKYLTLDGKPIVQVDIKNSQPLFLASIAKDMLRSNTPFAKALLEHKTDIDYYCNVVTSGIFYEVYGRGMGYEVTSKYIRDIVKTTTYSGILFGKSGDIRNSEGERSIPAEAFEELFPGVYRIIEHIKRGNYKNMAKKLQQTESTFIFDTIDAINREHPEIQMVTIHDSICTTPEHAEYVNSVVKERFYNLYGLRATTSVEPF